MTQWKRRKGKRGSFSSRALKTTLDCRESFRWNHRRNNVIVSLFSPWKVKYFSWQFLSKIWPMLEVKHFKEVSFLFHLCDASHVCFKKVVVLKVTTRFSTLARGAKSTKNKSHVQKWHITPTQPGDLSFKTQELDSDIFKCWIGSTEQPPKSLSFKEGGESGAPCSKTSFPDQNSSIADRILFSTHTATHISIGNPRNWKGEKN